MRLMMPTVEVEDDNDYRIMARDGSLVGLSYNLAVWRFGYLTGGPHTKAHNCARPWGKGFLWVLCTRKTGKIKETFEGFALNLPENFRRVIEWEPRCPTR